MFEYVSNIYEKKTFAHINILIIRNHFGLNFLVKFIHNYKYEKEILSVSIVNYDFLYLTNHGFNLYMKK